MGHAAEERMTTAISDTRESLSRDVDALYDKVSPGRVVERRKRAMGRRISSLKDSVMGSAQDATGSAQHATHRAAGSVQDAATGAVDAASGAVDAATGAARSAVDTVERRTQGAPLAAGLAAFGAGMVIAAMIPASQKETEAAHRLTDAAKDSPVLDQAKAAGQEIGESLKESAEEAADHLRTSAQESASTVKEEAGSAAQSVKDEAPGT